MPRHVFERIFAEPFLKRVAGLGKGRDDGKGRDKGFDDGKGFPDAGKGRDMPSARLRGWLQCSCSAGEEPHH